MHPDPSRRPNRPPHTPALHTAPAVGFDQAFEMLQTCHERLEQRLGLLGRLNQHLAAQGADAQAQGAAADLLRYFERAAPLHHEDEERHLLPRLRALGQGALAERLAAEHQQLQAGWQQLAPGLRRIAVGEPAALDAGWPQWVALYRAHMACEDGEAFRTAQAGLTAEALQAMGQEMAGRRGATVLGGLPDSKPGLKPA